MGAPGKTWIEIDSLRALAVTGVLCQHWLYDQLHGVPLGPYGVRLFFVISGFLITDLLLAARNRVDQGVSTRTEEFRTFYIRRFLRIFPAYYGLLAVTAALDVGEVRQTLVYHLTYTSNLLLAFHAGAYPLVEHLWSLAVEEQFYALWPIAVLCLPRRGLPAAILTMIAGAVVWRFGLAAAGVGPYAVKNLTPGCMDTLGLGALLAWGRRNGQAPPGAATGALAAGLALTLAITVVGRRAPDSLAVLTLRDLGAGLLSVGVLAKVVAHSGASWLSPLRLKPVLYVGTISYGLYLLHPFAARALSVLAPAIEAKAWAPAAFAACAVTAAALSWSLFEAPISRLKARVPYPPADRPPAPKAHAASARGA